MAGSGGFGMDMRRVAAPFVLREDRDGIACLTLGAGAGNLLSQPVRAALAAALQRAASDPRVQAVLIAAAGGDLSRGLPAAERAAPLAQPDDADLAAALESCPRPVVLLLSGRTEGLGAALALAAHYRIATPDAVLRFDEAPLGLLPRAGAGQRLPRLAGSEAALRLLGGGADCPADEALRLGLVDRIAGGAPLSAALEFAREAAALGPRPASASDRPVRDGATALAAVRAARADLARQGAGHPLRAARAAVVDCIEAATLLPFETALAYEAEKEADIRAGDDAQGLCHSDRIAARARTGRAAWPDTLPARALVVAGAGAGRIADAAALAEMLLAAGLAVDLRAVDQAGLVAALEQVALRQEAAVSAGRDPALREADWARLTGWLDAPPGPFGLVAGDATGQAAPVAGGLAVQIARAPAAPGLAALRLHGPLAQAQAVELVAPQGGAAAALAAALRAGGVGVIPAGEGAEAPGDRLAAVLARVAAFLVATGTPAAAVDAALTGWGYARGPFAQAPDLSSGPRGGTALDAEAVVMRVNGALANEGARLLEEGVVERPGDVDLAAQVALGFPAARGGPLHWADRLRVVRLRSELKRIAAEAPRPLAAHAQALWAPSPLVAELIKNGWGFADLDEG